MPDKLLLGWTNIESVTPYAFKPDFFRRKYGKWMRDNGYVLKDKINNSLMCFSWESLIKAGICRMLTEKDRKKIEKKNFMKSTDSL